MAWFNGNKKITLPGFPVNAFGKLPFYKEYLYLCPDPAFAELKAWVDQSFEQLSRQGADPPYLSPNRHFLVHLPSHKTDLVGSIWDSHDGLRAFPFMIAMAMPRKARKYGLPLFWQCLTSVWDYFERYFSHLSEAGSASDFYKRIRGVVHQLPKIVQSAWPEEATPSEGGRMQLENGGLARFNLREDRQSAEAWLNGLALPQLPNFVLWPQGDFQATPHEAVGFIGMNGLEMIDLDLFQPKAWNGAPGEGRALVAEPMGDGDKDLSETDTIILKPQDKLTPEDSGPLDESRPGERLGPESLEEEIEGLEEGHPLNLPPLSPIAEALETKEDDIPTSWLENPTDETLSGAAPEYELLPPDPDEEAPVPGPGDAPTMTLSLEERGGTSELPLLEEPGSQEREASGAAWSHMEDKGSDREGHAGTPAEDPGETIAKDRPPAGRRPGLPTDER